MTQEEKSILLQDFFARLPYGIKCKDQYGDYININIYNVHIEHLVDQISSGIIKMILRPMSSMTEKEIKELQNIDIKRSIFSSRHLTWHLDGEVVDYLNSHHFDYRGLIYMGLAIEAPEEMYKN